MDTHLFAKLCFFDIGQILTKLQESRLSEAQYGEHELLILQPAGETFSWTHLSSSAIRIPGCLMCLCWTVRCPRLPLSGWTAACGETDEVSMTKLGPRSLPYRLSTRLKRCGGLMGAGRVAGWPHGFGLDGANRSEGSWRFNKVQVKCTGHVQSWRPDHCLIQKVITLLFWLTAKIRKSFQQIAAIFKITFPVLF